MNYRHVFHAGNRCDVVKHAILTLVIGHLRLKDKGFLLLDTHAGTGFYDLTDPRALKTGEAEEGIKRLLADKETSNLPQLAEYIGILRKMNPLWDGKGPEGCRIYPGSPLLAFHMLRQQDRLVACEKHPQDAETLRLQSPDDARMQVHCRDGYEAMRAFLPPQEKRGAALIDPPYEQPDEFETVVEQLKTTYRRWPSGTYLIWYPIKDLPKIWQFHESLLSAGIEQLLCAEFTYDDSTKTDRLTGSGMIIANPPWTLENDLQKLFPVLHKTLASGCGGFSIKSLVNRD